jgi:hypothetical protein
MTPKTPPSSKPSKLSDAQLREALAGLREEVAAPPDFRAKLMQRLQREGLVQGQALPAAEAPSLWRRLSALLTPQRLGLATSAALALFVIARFLPRPAQAPQALDAAVPTAAAAALPAPAKPAAQAHRKPAGAEAVPEAELASAGPVKETLPEALLDETAVPQPEAAVGASSPDAPLSSSQFSASAPQAGAAAVPSTGAGAPVPGGGGVSSASAKPTVVVIEPTATPVIKALQGNSELRGNVIRASQGEAAVLLYRVLIAGHVRAEIFDRLGHAVALLKDADQGAGTYDLRWNGQGDNGHMAATGIYVLQLTAPGYQAQHKLALVK